MRLIVLAIFLSNFSILNSQNLLKTDGTTIVNQNQETIILRGMGLGGWMIQEGYMLQTASFANAQHKLKEKIEELVGTEAMEDFYSSWLQNHMTKRDVDSLKSWGFNSVRLPMHYNLYTLPIEEEPIPGENTWLEIGFQLTDSLISWCAQNEMYVVLDLHAAPGGQGYDEGISDYDPDKPSLWESQENRDKMASLWRVLAERYSDEEWVAGYDLLNEPNWNLPNGVALRTLYEQVTDSIRSVDSEHILFIEGNWFANDFSGLTPPWDDNLVYSPHKYWSINDEASMEFALSLRETHNVPLYLGESGENSNVWFRDAIKLMEDLGIGWAWWPMKKVDNISGPLSVPKSAEYSYLLNYWSGNASEPTAEYAIDALMGLAEGFRMENCVYQKDVIDAMFRQVQSDETLPFSDIPEIPGVVYASDFNLGVLGEAYMDLQTANYHVSTGEFTDWNTGWSYRNDGVDIEPCDDNVNSNGYNVGWIGTGEWMKFTVNVTEASVYDIHLRIASGGSDGELHFLANGIDVSTSESVPNSGGWDSWESMTVQDVILDAGETEIVFYADNEGFNLSSMEFINTNTDPSDINTEFISAITLNESNIEMTVNKPIQGPVSGSEDLFSIQVNGTDVPILEVQLNNEDTRKFIFELDDLLTSTDIVKITYNGNQITSEDGSSLSEFTLEDVENNLLFASLIPGLIEAENFYYQEGVQLEDCTDSGGGLNIGYLDEGDYLDYNVSVQNTGKYAVDFRTAAQFGGGGIQIQKIDDSGQTSFLGEYAFDSTGGWQTWVTTSDSIDLEAGNYGLRAVITESPFNLNWMKFDLPLPTDTLFNPGFNTLLAFPNPASSSVTISLAVFLSQDFTIYIYDSRGRRVYSKDLIDVSIANENISLTNFQDGLYHVMALRENGEVLRGKFIKTSN